MKISQVKFSAGALAVTYTMVDPKDPNARIEREERFTRVAHPDLNWRADLFRTDLIRFYRFLGTAAEKDTKDLSTDEMRCLNDTANKVTITKIKVSGKDASQGVNILGKYKIATGGTVPLQSGHIMYNKMPELEDKVNALFEEVASYVGGKSEQPQLPFGDDSHPDALDGAEDAFQAAKERIRAQANAEPAQAAEGPSKELLSVPELLEMPRAALLNLASVWQMGGVKNLSDSKLRERMANWHTTSPHTYPLVAPMPQGAVNQQHSVLGQA